MKGIANIERWKAMHSLRSSNAAQPHRNHGREARRGAVKGGKQAAIRNELKEEGQ